ncbi:MAG: DNA mismatch repair endonuclease MutL, partial [Clostridiales bacterium]|nr:DNA mismatch repair endonuclease MutL [Clostridiales bacterium]
KIMSSSDLEAISTLGLRGEAMASIAAVSKVEMLTKTENEQHGTRYEICAGEEKDFSEAGCPNGTTIVVRDIFYNVPARMKFLKKDVTEGNSVKGVIDRISLSHPEISFRFIRDGKQALLTSGNGDLKSTVYSVFGSELSDSLIPVNYEYNSMQVSGYISRPHQSRKSRAMQFFFINGRLVKSATAMAALEQAYKNSIMTGRYPACVLNIKMDSKLVDVNVHPAKTEVRFINEKPVFNLIYYGVKTAIETQNSVKKANFPKGLDTYNSDFNVQKTVVKTNKDFYIKPSPAEQLKFSSSPPVSEKPQSNTWRLSSSSDSYSNTGSPRTVSETKAFRNLNADDKKILLNQNRLILNMRRLMKIPIR